MTQPNRHTRRQILAAIALATDLPTPHSVVFYDWGLVLSFDTLADGLAWAGHLDGKPDTYDNGKNGRRYLSHGVIHWHGWRISIEASEPTVDEPLDANAAADLAAVVDVSPAAAAAEVPADLAPIETPGLHYADETPQPMTGAEALDAATSPAEWAATANSIFGAYARAAHDAEDDQ